MQITGKVVHIIYANPQNHYAIFEMSGNDGVYSVVGTFPFLAEGETVCVQGEMVMHPKYGEQFRALSYTSAKAEDADDVYAFLSSGVIQGIGEVKAFDLIQAFGEKTLDYLENDPLKLTAVKGIGKKTALAASDSYKKQKDLKETISALCSLGISMHYILRLYEQYGYGAVAIVKKNPYVLMDEMEGIGFKRADAIAAKIGFGKEDPVRVRSGIVHIMQKLTFEMGCAYVEERALVRRTAGLLEIDVAAVQEGIGRLVDAGRLVQQTIAGQSVYYLEQIYRCEVSVAEDLARLAHAESSSLHQEDLESLVANVEQTERLSLHETQRLAVMQSLCANVSLITGGPGTGKTTIIRAVLCVFERLGKTCLLAAPTGRAAKRMGEQTQREAKTIHRLLKYTPKGQGNGFAEFGVNREDPLKCDALIVDEMSMVDLLLFSSLLSGIKTGTKLILVGDQDQLPSISVGTVLSDLIASRRFPTTVLTKIFRQKDTGSIALNAHRINQGTLPDLSNAFKDFTFLCCDDEAQALSKVKRVLQTFMKGRDAQTTMMSVQVLSAMKNGVLGVHNLNAVLQTMLNAPAASKAQVQIGGQLLREGDKVMQIKNNYDITSRNLYTQKSEQGVFNGDMGLISFIDTEKRQLGVVFDFEREVRYAFDEAGQLSLAYSVTVHKSQGSEFPVVVLVLAGTGSEDFYTRNLLYTAVSRAKNRVILLSTPRRIAMMVKNNRTSRRTSSLQVRIKEQISHEYLD